MKQKCIGYYSSYQYGVEIDGVVVYTAGNSPYDSQGYTTKEAGVGLDTMREYCEKTTRDIADEHKAKYLGVEFAESTETDFDECIADAINHN